MGIFTSCEGAFEWVYDEPIEVQSVEGQIYFDASAWDKWYYIDLKAIADSVSEDSSYDASESIVCMDIPMEAVGDTMFVNGNGLTGQYMYWYDIFGQGLVNNKFEYFIPTAKQPEPDDWTIAIHRDNVRTNGGAVWESDLTDVSLVHPSLYSGAKFQEDEFTENDVWDDNSRMIMKYVPSQGININKVLSSWLTMHLIAPPPTFTHNNHVFVLRLKDGTYAALQLVDYVSSTNKKCCLTIKYKYPV